MSEESPNLTKDDFSIHDCTHEEAFCYISKKNPEMVIKQILKNQEDAKQYNYLKPWLKDNLTGKQVKEIGILTDPLSRKILAYLASNNDQTS